jgi:hypothetical protein
MDTFKRFKNYYLLDEVNNLKMGRSNKDKIIQNYEKRICEIENLIDNTLKIIPNLQKLLIEIHKKIIIK